MLNKNTDFNSFYGSSQSLAEGKELVVKHVFITVSDADVYIYRSMFCECINSGGHGGAIYNVDSIRFLVEDSSFISCTSSQYNGGGIYFKKTSNGKVLLNRICAINCGSYNLGQCFFIEAGENFLCNNNVNDSSLFGSFFNSDKAQYTMSIENGNILLTGNNESKNTCERYSALNCNSDQNSAKIVYSSFVNNTAKQYGCLYFQNAAEMHKCNIIKNDQDTEVSPSTIHASSSLFIWGSCILENNIGKRVFHEEASSSYRIMLMSCTIDGDIFSGSRYVGNVTIKQTNERDFINGLVHLNTFECEASYDSVGTLTVDVNDIELKNDLCITYVRNLNGSGTSAIKVMKYALLNSFLPSDE